MAINATVIRAYPRNTGVTLTGTTGVSEDAGTAETFDFVFPAKDETCYIVIKNGNSAAVTAKLLPASSGNGFSGTNFTVAKNAVCVYAIESGFVKAADGKISLLLTPDAAKTIYNSGCYIYGVCGGKASY